MYLKQIVGFAALIIGVYLIATAGSSMDTTGQKVKKEITGDYTRHTRNNMIGGIALVVLGGGLLLFWREKP